MRKSHSPFVLVLNNPQKEETQSGGSNGQELHQKCRAVAFSFALYNREHNSQNAKYGSEEKQCTRHKVKNCLKGRRPVGNRAAKCRPHQKRQKRRNRNVDNGQDDVGEYANKFSHNFNTSLSLIVYHSTKGMSIEKSTERCFFSIKNQNIKSNRASAARSAGIAMVMPILRKSRYPNLRSCFLRIELHIIPASAPMGERQAPRFEPTTVA